MAGIPAQGVLGAIVVWTNLNPIAVQLHFVLSMVLVALAVVLVIRSREPDGAKRVSTVVPRTKHRLRLMVVWTALAIVAGTVVTGTGPHAGDDKARRFTFLSITWVARIHSAIVWIAVLMAISLLWHLRKRAHDREVLDAPLTAVDVRRDRPRRRRLPAVRERRSGDARRAACGAGNDPVGDIGVAVVHHVASEWHGAQHDRGVSGRQPLRSVAAAEAADELAELVDGRAEERAD